MITKKQIQNNQEDANCPLKIESIRFEDLSFSYENEGPLFENINFEFPKDQVILIKASSGAGRSSLLQILAGLQSPTQGQYLINDQDTTRMSFEEFLPYRLKIGYGFDYGGLINNRTLTENLLLPLQYHKVCTPKEALEKVEYFNEHFGLIRYKHHRPALVPGRIRKLVCLIRSLILEPEVLLLDDPTVGLSEEIILKFFDLIQKMRKNNNLRHIFISSFDDKMMSLLEHTDIYLDSYGIYCSEDEDNNSLIEKKTVNL